MTALAAHYTPEHRMFRDTCRRFFDKEVTPFHMKWEEDGIVPRVVASVHPRFHTPHIAIITYAILIAALAISSSFAQLAILANVTALALYLIGIAAAYELQRRDVRADGPPFHLPGEPAIPLLAAGVILWLLSNATIRELAVSLGVVAVASLFYAVRKRAI